MIFPLLNTEIYHDSSSHYLQIKRNQIQRTQDKFIKHTKLNQTK